MLIDAPLETELWLYALAAISGLHWSMLWPGFDDVVERMVRSCGIRAKA